VMGFCLNFWFKLFGSVGFMRLPLVYGSYDEYLKFTPKRVKASRLGAGKLPSWVHLPPTEYLYYTMFYKDPELLNSFLEGVETGIFPFLIIAIPRGEDPQEFRWVRTIYLSIFRIVS